jgi:hypothetical protein
MAAITTVKNAPAATKVTPADVKKDSYAKRIANAVKSFFSEIGSYFKAAFTKTIGRISFSRMLEKLHLKKKEKPVVQQSAKDRFLAKPQQVTVALAKKVFADMKPDAQKSIHESLGQAEKATWGFFKALGTRTSSENVGKDVLAKDGAFDKGAKVRDLMAAALKPAAPKAAAPAPKAVPVK